MCLQCVCIGVYSCMSVLYVLNIWIMSMYVCKSISVYVSMCICLYVCVFIQGKVHVNIYNPDFLKTSQTL